MTAAQDQNDIPETHINPGSWDELVAWLFRFSTSSRIYRGQRDYSWALRTRLARDLDKLPANIMKLSVENSAIGFFMDQAIGLLPNVPDEHDLLGWLALMQHYGAPTRLLDWSQSPFVATYFAYEQPSDDDSALYALDPYFCRRQFVGSLIPMPWDHTGTFAHSTTDKEGNTTTAYPARTQYRRDRENDLLRWSMTHSSGWPLPTIPFGQDARMTAQQTIFTLAGNVGAIIDDLFDKEKWPSPVERMPGGLIAGTDSTVWPLEHPGQLLTKIRLRSQWRGEALKALEKMGLTAASLFPGLDGLGRATSLHVEAGLPALRDVLTGLSPV